MSGRASRVLLFGAISTAIVLYLAGCSAAASVHPGVLPPELPQFIVITAGPPVGRPPAPAPEKSTPEPFTPSSTVPDGDRPPASPAFAGSAPTAHTPPASAEGGVFRSPLPAPPGRQPAASSGETHVAASSGSQLAQPPAASRVSADPTTTPAPTTAQAPTTTPASRTEPPRTAPPLTLPNAGGPGAPPHRYDPVTRRCVPDLPPAGGASDWQFYATPAGPENGTADRSIIAGQPVELHLRDRAASGASPVELSVTVVSPNGATAVATTLVVGGNLSGAGFPSDFGDASGIVPGIYTVLWDSGSDLFGCSGFIVAE